MQNKKTDITKPIGIALFVILILLAFCSKSDAASPGSDEWADSKGGGTCYQIDETYGGKTSGMCDTKVIHEHKVWAGNYHTEKNKDRYEHLIEEIIGHDIKLKPKKLNFKGFTEKDTMESWRSDGSQAEVKGANEFAYSGNTFYSVTADLSECVATKWFSDCKQDNGSTRVEVRDDKEWTFTEGTEKWINFAILPANNVLFEDWSRRFTVSQCHPGESPITWMIKFVGGNLVLEHNYRWTHNENGWFKMANYGGNYHTLKKLTTNERHGSMEWTNVRIYYHNSMDPNKGQLTIWIDGEKKWDYKGPTGYDNNNSADNKKIGKKCRLRFGLYTNANLAATHPALAENMQVWFDAMAVAKTEDKLIKLLKKDK
jgi:hypothetical protein